MPYSNAAEILETPVTTHEVRVPNRFNGPPGSGNGGWSAALLGKHLGPEVEVTLKRPIPLDRDIRVIANGSSAVLVDGDSEIASARSAELELDIPEAISFAEAARARATFAGYQDHPFPKCFVCGTGRCCGEGMCLFTGPLDKGIVASSWVPDAEFVTEEGEIAPELICAALDCPGAWGLIDRYGIEGPIVLGRMTYRFDKPIYAGERYVVMGWAQGREGRKLSCGTAVYDAEGAVCAAAGATWIELR
ncbi:MAG: hypothetical protein AMJ63_12590 [Myxococcales bacterium SG8_38_1]|jgi:hypothetical protein|nr:MAG: hypothetical protein AMJ63_12590 [Myxococcales bacterium SG8_38_1]